jgi:translation initiation factor 2 beta subunit (eIF-2beta)/eIF-5
MSKIPIPNNELTQIDPSYRYMRNTIKLSKSGQFMAMENINEICTKQLCVKTNAFLKYLKTQIAQSIKNMGNDKYGIKNKTQNEIELILEKFIVDHICCKNCGLPEIDLLNDDDVSYKICKACGSDCANQIV